VRRERRKGNEVSVALDGGGGVDTPSSVPLTCRETDGHDDFGGAGGERGARRVVERGRGVELPLEGFRKKGRRERRVLVSGGTTDREERVGFVVLTGSKLGML